MRNKKLKHLNEIGTSIKHMSKILKVTENTIRKRKKSLNLSEYCKSCGKILTKDEKTYCNECKTKKIKIAKKPENEKYRFKHRHALKTKICQFCGKEFKTRNSLKKYCSKQCYQSAKTNRGFSKRLKQKNTVSLESILAYSSLDENNQFILEPLTISEIASHGDIFSITLGKNQIGNSNLNGHPKEDFNEEKKIIKREMRRLLRKS